MLVVTNRQKPAHTRRPRRGGWARKTPTAIIDGNEERLSLDIIEMLKRRGMNQSQVAELFGVTRQAVSYWVMTYNGALTARAEILRAHWPFTSDPAAIRRPLTVSVEHHQASVAHRLRDHAEYYATGGRGMSEDKLDRLATFYPTLENRVVMFDPALPPLPGFALSGGWALVPREAGDGRLMLRVNEHTIMTDEAYRIWQLPTND